MKPRLNGLNLFLDWLMICVGVFGSMLCLCTAFELPVFPTAIEPVFPAFWVLPPALALAGCLCFSGKKGKYFALGFFAVLALLCLLAWKELVESARNLWGVLCIRYARGYDQLQDYLPRDPTSPEATRGALLMLTAVETFLCTLSVRLWKRTVPAALSLLPGILPCFILTDTPPDLLPLMAAAFSVLTQAYSQIVRRRAAGEEPKAVFLAGLLAAGLLSLLLLLFPKEQFEPPITWKDLSRELEQWGMEQSNRGNLNAGLTGNPDEVDLRALGALPNHPSTVLYAASSQDGYLYLRGSSYTDFNGSCWRRGADRSWDESCLYPYLRRSDGQSLTIETVEPEGLLFTTYQTTRLPAGGEIVSDAFLRNAEGRQRYTMQYLPDLGPVSSFDAAYDRWVSEHCLALPDETREAVLDWWTRNRGSLPLQPIEGCLSDGSEYTYRLAKGVESVESLAQQVAWIVSQSAVYSRNPLQAPDDADFCTWFLNEAEEGYCVHFATSCAALLRALGVPARYVSGYVCPVKANHTATVTNLQAHAWVEIWYGGRWVCIEPTPGDATEFSGWTEVPNELRPEDTHEPLPTEPQILPTETPEPPPTEVTRPAVTKPRPDPNSTDEHGEGYSNTRETEPLDLTWLWVFLGVTGFLALVLGRRALALRLWEQKLARAPANERARLLYRRILRLHRHRGGPISPEAERAAKKAGFSQHTLNDEELHVLRQLYDQQVSRIGISSFWNKLYCKYILAII